MSGLGVDLSVNSRLTPDDHKLLVLAEHFGPDFVQAWEMKHPSVMRDRIPRGVFTLFNGLNQTTNVFRGVLGPQQGLSDWTRIEPSLKPSGNTPGKDYCSYNSQTYTWAFESFTFSGLRTSWKSPHFCVNDLKFTDYAKEQLSYIIRAGSQVSDQIKETFNREEYVKAAVDAGNAFIMAEGALGYIDSSTYRFSYDPMVKDSDGDTYLTFADSILPNISTLNWSFLDYVRAYLTDMAPDAAVSSEGGSPVFGLMIDVMDFERMVYKDASMREDFRHARAEQLISGFNMGFKTYRGFALMNDPRQMRFKIQKITSNTVYAKRVVPRRQTRAGTIGLIPETNPEYLQAELAIGLVFMSDVIQILVPATINNMGSGMTFGPAPDYNGAWSWINIKDNENNPLGEIGYFFSRYEYFVKPLQYSTECTAFLYRRCPQAIKTECAVENDENVGVGAVSLAVATVTADFDSTNRAVTLTLAKKLEGSLGASVTIKKDDGNSFVANIAEDRDAPTYTFVWESGATNAPSAYDEMNDPAIVTVTVA